MFVASELEALGIHCVSYYTKLRVRLSWGRTDLSFVRACYLVFPRQLAGDELYFFWVLAQELGQAIYYQLKSETGLLYLPGL